jgi:hypothetical protein
VPYTLSESARRYRSTEVLPYFTNESGRFFRKEKPFLRHRISRLDVDAETRMQNKTQLRKKLGKIEGDPVLPRAKKKIAGPWCTTSRQ